jgi:nitroimidazol reductase NimA-like FMN-containing flavoprotein (pyridoxamine 5'-phosphate oxidase superfamily)
MTTTPSDASRVRRHPERAAYDAETVHAILDAATIAHVGFVVDERPFVIPMLYGRVDDIVYLHGSVASRLQRTLGRGVETCLTATIVDGLVLARSAFHHSMNYRSVVVTGLATPVSGDEKMAGLRAISEHLLPGRWTESRVPNDIELRQTSVLRLPIDDASAKRRTGGPLDDDEDMALPVWAGVLPYRQAWGEPEPDGDLSSATSLSPAVEAALAAAVR